MTFEEVWKEVLLHAPMASPLLARRWVQWAYDRASELRPWSSLRRELEVTTAASKGGTATVTLGSTAVLGGTLAFAATDLYRQFRIGTSPIYTIAAVAAPNATLDRAYTGATGAVTAEVLDAYLTCPADFQRWMNVVDIENRWRLRHYITEDWLNKVDPAREHTDAPRALVSHLPSRIPAILGRVTYELWPYSITARRYPALYVAKPDTLVDTTTIPGPLGRRTDVLTNGALSRCAKWPGVEGRKNPYFDLALSKALATDFEQDVARLEVQDEDVYPTWMPMSEYRWAPWPNYIGDANWLRMHDAAVS